MNNKLNLHPIATLSLVTILGIISPLFDCNTSFAATSIANTTDMSTEDKQRVMELLKTRQLQRLEAHYKHLQYRYEIEHSMNDWQLFIQYQPFYDTDPTIEALLTEWISQFPESYPARLARGIYYRKSGEKKRGGKWANETPRESFEQLSKYLDLATDDLLASRPLTKKPIVSIIHLLNVTKHRDGDSGNRYWLEEANRIDPLNYGARRRYMYTLTPRWGGSYEEMYAYLQECRSENVPSEHIRIFESIIHKDRADMLRHTSRPTEAFAQYRQALMFLSGIENEEAIEALNGLIYSARESNALERVVDEIDQYLRIRPKDSNILSYRGWLHQKHGKHKEAWSDYLQAATLGHAWSQFQVGQILYRGAPPLIPQNQKEGMDWVMKAADQGHKPAVKFMEELSLAK